MNRLKRPIDLPPWWNLILLMVAIVATTAVAALTYSWSGHGDWIRPSTALIVGVVLLARPGHRFVYACVAAVVQTGVAVALFGGPVLMRVLIGLLVLNLFLVTSWLGRDRAWLDGRDDGWRAWRRFALWGVLVVPLGTSVLVAAVIGVFSDAPYWETVLGWSTAMAVSVAMIVPVMLRARTFVEGLRARPLATGLPLVVFWGAASAVFVQSSHLWVFVLFPLLAAIVFRGGVALTSVALLGLTAVVVALTGHGHGPFATSGEPPLTTQVYLLLVWAAAYLTAALLDERQRGMRETVASQAMFRKLADHSADIVFLCDDRGACSYVSPSMTLMLGHPAAAFMGMAWLSFVHPEDLLKVTPNPHDVATSGGVRYRLRHSEGHYVAVESLWRECGPDAEGRRQVVGTSRDVSAREQHEAELLRVHEVMELAVGVGGVGIWEADLARGGFRSNAILNAIYGHPVTTTSASPAGDLRGFEEWIDAVHPGDRARAQAVWQDAVRTRTGYELVFRIVRADGAVRHLRSTCLVQVDGDGRARRTIGTTVDITEQLSAGEQLATQKETLALALEAGGVGFWQYDFERDLVLWDARMHTLYEGSVGDFRAHVAPDTWGGRLHEIIENVLRPEDRASAERQLAAMLRGESDRIRMSMRLPLKNGHTRHLRLSGHVSRRTDGALKALAGLNWDVTAEHELNATLKRAKLAADDANRAKSEFLANMGHEIRTPMNGVLGMLGLALETSLSVEQREYLQAVHESAVHMLAVINDILDFAKIEAGTLDLRATPYELRSLLTTMLVPLRARAVERGLELVVRVADDVPGRIHGDWGRVSQVLVHLVGNALKFTDQGRVTLTIGWDATTRCVGFRVEDTGSGIAAEQRARIFAPFEQADRAITRRHGGTGLGLAISSRLVEMMGGVLALDSELGRGSVFSFALPSGLAPVEQRSGLSVLVADDNIINQRVLQLMLESLGHHVRVAQDGQQALDVLSLEAFDVVLMDIEMPRLDGLAATARIRASERGRGARLPIVALTSHARDGDRERFIAAGLDDCITKPVSVGAVLGALAGVTART